MAFLIIGGVLLVAAVIAVAFAVHTKRRWHAMVGTETSTVAQLAGDLATVHQLGGATFNRVCEVSGPVEAGPDGELRSELAKLPCVWYRYEVRRRYWHTSTDSEGRTTRSQRTESVAELASAQPFRLADGTGSVLVRPDGLAIDRAERVVDRFEPDQTTESVSFLGIQLNTRSDTIGYEHEEWIVRPGTRLYVLGEATGHGGDLTIGKPAQGVHIISTRSEDQLRGSAQRTQRILMWSGLAAAVIGVTLLVLAAVR